MNRHWVRLGKFLLVLVFACGQGVFADPASLKAALEGLLNDQPAKALGISGRRMASSEISAELLERYREQGLNPVWVTPDGPGDRATILYKTLKSAPDEGLRSEDYWITEIDALWLKRSDVDLAKLEILLSVGLASYVADAREGRADPRKLDRELFAKARDISVDPVELAVEAIHAEDLEQFLSLQVPDNVHYRRLRTALAKYREIAADGDWEAVPSGETLKPGMESERVSAVRARLVRSGDLSPESPAQLLYDDDLEVAVKKFQKRFHLDIDGAIGKQTVASMNLTVNQLIRRITVNMERWRWLSHDLGDKRIFVNIAGFQLDGSNDSNVEISMPVIVGEKYHKTPVFSGSIKYLEFNPYWNVPPSIASNEMYPELLKNPNYLRKKNIKLFYGWGEGAPEVNASAIDWPKVGKRGIRRFKLRQEPGPKNSLGRIKFMFPNEFNVYLHDTPVHHLFKRSRRDFSHGCIRVSRPLELASYLLGGEEKGWDLEKMQEIVNSRKRTIIKLEKPYPVHILYRTATVGDDGLVYFADDVYGRDRLLEKALF